MSHAFLVSQVHSHRGCGVCKRARWFHHGKRYSLCTEHLAYAREAWRKHCRRCRVAGRCINCPEPKLPRELRCAACKEVNRVRALTWTRAHKGYSHRGWLLRKRRYLEQGLCLCRKHTRLPAGFRRCDACRKRHNTYKRKDLQAPTVRV